jgi:REP element-mobilizing transposase RayT
MYSGAMGATVGVHLIWTCKGTWLPGDSRGHWSPLFDMYGRLRADGQQLQMPDATTREYALSRMKDDPKILADDEFDIVADCFADHFSPMSAEGVVAHACAIEPTHVHLLVGPVRESIDRFVGRLKGASSSALMKHPSNWGRSHNWTTGYWKVFLFDLPAMHAVAQYIEKHNQRRGLPATPYHWLQPLT